jgi:hypothetical protein
MQIFPARNRIKVVGIYTPPVPAQMIEVKAAGDRPFKPLVYPPMRPHMLVFGDVKLAVTLGV